jgi:hypothetical protein
MGIWQCLYDYGMENPRKYRGNTAQIPREVNFLALAREFRGSRNSLRPQKGHNNTSMGPFSSPQGPWLWLETALRNGRFLAECQWSLECTLCSASRSHGSGSPRRDRPWSCTRHTRSIPPKQRREGERRGRRRRGIMSKKQRTSD